MLIRIDTMFTYVDFQDDENAKEKVRDMAHHTLGIKEDGAFHSRAYKSGYWDGITDFYDMKEDKFPTGLLDQFLEGLRHVTSNDLNIKYQVEDDRPSAPLSVYDVEEAIEINIGGDVGTVPLFDYQYTAVKRVFEEKIGLVNIATNGGKCVPLSANLLTSEGILSMEEFITRAGLIPSSEERDIPYNNDIYLVNRYGKLEKPSHITFNGVKKLKRITLDSGLEQEATLNHPLLVVNQLGEFEWVKTEDITEGDLLVTRAGDNIYGSNNVVTCLKEAYCIGALIADGTLSDKRKLMFSNDRPELLGMLGNYFKELSPNKLCTKSNPKSKGTDILVHDVTRVTEWFDRLGLETGLAKDKEIPQCIMEAPKDIQLAFLSGYIECECSIDTERVSIEVTSASKKLVNQLQLMLKNIGILSTLREKVVRGYEHNYYGRLNIRTKYAHRLLSMLTFTTPQRLEQRELCYEVYATRKHRPFKEAIPNGRELLEAYGNSVPELGWKERKKFKGPKTSLVGRDRVTALLKQFPSGDATLKAKLELLAGEEYYFDKVVTVEDIEAQPTFDVCMPATHSFIANSVVNHNTAVASGLISQLLPRLKRGERIAFFTHARELFHQSAKNIAQHLGLKPKEIGFIGDGKFDIKNKKIVFVMVPTLNSALKDPKKGIKFTHKDRVIKYIAEEITPKFVNTANTRQLLRNYIKNCTLTTKVWQDVEEALTYIAYDKKFTDKSAQMHLKKYIVEFDKVMEKKNKSKYQKYKDTVDFLDSIVMMIADEAHHSKADTWYNSLLMCSNAIYRVGLTGTVDKKDKMGYQRLRGLFNQVITRVSNEYLIERGVSSKPVIRMVPIKEPRTVEFAGTFMEAYKAGIVENDYRNQAIAGLAASYRERRPGGILISVKEISHGDAILALLQEKGVEAKFIHGSSTDEYRADTLASFGRGELPIMIASTIIDEGVDLKSIGCIILGAGGKSMRQQLQRIGRGLRLNGIDGNTVMVFDFYDYTNKFLRKHSEERVKLFKAENFDIKMIGE